MAGQISLAKQEFRELLLSAVNETYRNASITEDDIRNSLAIPEQSYGDLSSSISFRLSKILKKSPHDVALSMMGKLRSGKLIQKFSEVNGYINAFLDERTYSRLVIESVVDDKERYGSSSLGKNETVLIESPAVNPAHPWHVGHLRNALLGNTISNLLSFCGYRVEREDYIDDLGLQAAQAFWGYTNFKDEDKERKTKFDLFLGEKYVEAERAAGDNKIEVEIKEVLKAMEDTASETSRQVRKVAERCVMAQYETAFNFGIYHDVMIWESDIVGARLLDTALRLAKDKNAVEMPKNGDYANCVVLNLEKVRDVANEFQSPKEIYKVLVRSSGIATYAMKDFAFHLWKFGILDAGFKYSVFMEKQPNGIRLYSTSSKGGSEKFGNAKRVINVIDMSQGYEQATVKALLKLTGNEHAYRNLFHLAYGKVSLKEGSLSGRKGGWLGSERNYTADDLLEEATARALEIAKNSKKIASENAESVARSVALAAIKFEYLRVAPEKAIVFSWENALNFEANSGPYVLYMYVRACKILEKGNYSAHNPTNADYSSIKRGSEFELIKEIGRLQEVLELACKDCRPNTITDYLLELSSAFSKFYETSPVLTGGESKEIRLAIVNATMQAIGNALRVLGITPLEAM